MSKTCRVTNGKKYSKYRKDALQDRCVKILHQVTKRKLTQDEAKEHQEFVIDIIAKEIETSQKEFHYGNQRVLNLAIRIYYQLVKLYKLDETYLSEYFANEDSLDFRNVCDFQILFGAAQSDAFDNLDNTKLINRCFSSLLKAIDENKPSLNWIVKSINVLLKKNRHLDFDLHLNLDQAYFCLHPNFNSFREEFLQFFSYCCKNTTVAVEYFQTIIDFWPWTNRNKYFLLGAIFEEQNFEKFSRICKFNVEDFFTGLRLSLSYKALLSASQFLVFNLSKQGNEQILQLSAKILTEGNSSEIENFHAHWWGRIHQKDALFDLLKEEKDVILDMFETNVFIDEIAYFRLVTLLSMFPHQIFEASRLLFFKFSTHFVTQCFQMPIEIQFEFLSFFSDNLTYFSMEDCMFFFSNFVEKHYNVECSRYRNTLLGRMPRVINYVANYYRKVRLIDCRMLEESIVNFFSQIQALVELNIQSEDYQSKVFGLKSLEVLWHNLYAENIRSFAKDCCIENNKVLRSFLLDQHVFDKEKVSQKTLKILEAGPAYDDLLEIRVNLLRDLNTEKNMEAFELCRSTCRLEDVDKCSLSDFFVKVALNIPGMDREIEKLYKECCEILEYTLINYRSDPLNTCKMDCHLFGYLNVLQEIIKKKGLIYEPTHIKVLEIVKDITDTILELLNLANENSTAPSFQDMEESLQLLVTRSAYVEANQELTRKFLLMTFWLTLKASAELTAVIGCSLYALELDKKDLCQNVELCLNIITSILSKCRHKGAIESAGLAIGKLTNKITSNAEPGESIYNLLFKQMDVLFEEPEKVSTTRRGAGFAIMFLHILKNEQNTNRPLLRIALENIITKLKTSEENTDINNKIANVDRLEAVQLHYLCSIVRDTILKETVVNYQNEILLAAIANIGNAEWTICNAALQLFGSIVPKILGQRSATEFDEPLEWETSEITFEDIERKLPGICEYIVEFCSKANNQTNTSSRSILLFLSFLSKVEHLKKSINDQNSKLIQNLKDVMWSLLSHQCVKIRKLAAISLVRLHEMRVELPTLLLYISQDLYKINNANIFEGFINILNHGLLKLENEGKYTLPKAEYENLLEAIEHNLVNLPITNKFFPFTFCKLLDLYNYLKLENNEILKEKISQIKYDPKEIGYDKWVESSANYQIELI